MASFVSTGAQEGDSFPEGDDVSVLDAVPGSPKKGDSGLTKEQIKVGSHFIRSVSSFVWSDLAERLRELSERTQLTVEALMRRAQYPSMKAMYGDFARIMEVFTKDALQKSDSLETVPLPYAELSDAVRAKLRRCLPEFGSLI